MNRYETKNYGAKVTVSLQELNDAITVHPGWFARVFLLRRPIRFTLREALTRLSGARGHVEEQMVRELFENGKR